jgi:hypothetical protein
VGVPRTKTRDALLCLHFFVTGHSDTLQNLCFLLDVLGMVDHGLDPLVVGLDVCLDLKQLALHRFDLSAHDCVGCVVV